MDTSNDPTVVALTSLIDRIEEEMSSVLNFGNLDDHRLGRVAGLRRAAEMARSAANVAHRRAAGIREEIASR